MLSVLPIDRTLRVDPTERTVKNPPADKTEPKHPTQSAAKPDQKAKNEYHE